MADLNNNLNVNSMHKAYAPNFKKGEEKTPPTIEEEVKKPAEETSLAKDPKAVVGQSQVKKSSTVNFKADMDAYMKNPQMAKRAINAGDLAYEMMDAQGVADAYAKACSGSIDAVK